MCSQGWWGTTVWASGCPAKCWHSQLCLERVLQRMLLRTEFFWKLLGQGNTWGAAGLIQCCLQYAAGALPGSCMWEQAQELSLRAALTRGRLGRAGSQIYSSGLTSAPPGPWGAKRGRGEPRWAVLAPQPGTAGKGWSLCKPCRQGRGKAGQVEEDGRCHSVSFTGPEICNFRIFVCSFTLHQRHSDEWDYIEGEKLFQRKETKRKHFGLSLVFS